MSKKILAVSGGVDSMVLLDILKDTALVVAHFDHGTRDSSSDDEEFVRREASKYQKDYVAACGRLGENVSEEKARKARYDFLRTASVENGEAQIYTAHHLDDLVETVAINLLRGTGWRGLAVLDSPDIKRPLLEKDLLPLEVQGLAPFDKKQILQYAAEHQIAFREDPTNNSDLYLRNRLRDDIATYTQKSKIYELWQAQKQLKHEIDCIIEGLLPHSGAEWKRHWFVELDHDPEGQGIALELLRAGLLRRKIRATRPQLENLRQAILNYAPGKSFNLPGDRLVKFSKDGFCL